MSTVLSLRPMRGTDLPLVESWLRRPHVSAWWTSGTTADAEISLYRQRISGEEPMTHMLVVSDGETAIGWCQWYRWADYPEEALAIEAREGEVGIDYAIGEPGWVNRGVGTQLIAALVAEVRRTHPAAGILADPDATNVASRRVLEKNGFDLVAVRPVTTEPSDVPMAIYRLGSEPRHL